MSNVISKSNLIASKKAGYEHISSRQIMQNMNEDASDSMTTFCVWKEEESKAKAEWIYNNIGTQSDIASQQKPKVNYKHF